MLGTQTAFDFGTGQPARPAARTAPPGFALDGNAAPARAETRSVALEPAGSTLDEPPPADEPAGRRALEAALRGALALPVRITLTDNRRTMISLERGPRAVHVRLHHMFTQADGATLRALGAYLAHADRDAAKQIGRYIEQHRLQIRSRRVVPTPLSTSGRHHDLLEIYRDLNLRYFAQRIAARITWSRETRLPRGRARSIKLGSYSGRERLIRVHPALDAAFVPRLFVEYIVYHEMLHQAVPARRAAGGRRRLHGPEFRAQERRFEHYEAALRWERDNLDRLLSRG